MSNASCDISSKRTILNIFCTEPSQRESEPHLTGFFFNFVIICYCCNNDVSQISKHCVILTFLFVIVCFHNLEEILLASLIQFSSCFLIHYSYLGCGYLRNSTYVSCKFVRVSFQDYSVLITVFYVKLSTDILVLNVQLNLTPLVSRSKAKHR